jgi:hypothetical protein
MVSFIFMFIGAVSFHRLDRKLYMMEINKNLIVDLVPLNLNDKRFGKSGKDERFSGDETNTTYSIARIHETNEIIRKLSLTTIGDLEKCRFIKTHVESGICKDNVFSGGLMDEWLWESND